MSTYKVIKGADGKLSTQDGPSEEVAKIKLERTRRELRDMLSGNTQFHDDPRAEKNHGDYCIHHMLPEPCRMCNGGVSLKSRISVTLNVTEFKIDLAVLKLVMQELSKAPIQTICPDHGSVIPCRHCYEQGSCFANL